MVKELLGGGAAALKMAAGEMGFRDIQHAELSRPLVPGALEAVTTAGAEPGAEIHEVTANLRGRRLRFLIVVGPEQRT